MHKYEERESVTLENQGEKIFGILHRPLVEGKVPAVLFCSGYAGNKSGKFRLFVSVAQELVKRGIAVFRFDYRGTGDSEGESTDVTIEGKVSDTLKCLEFLAQYDKIDSDRIGLLGRSLGGLIGILSAKRYQKIKSLVLWAPVFNSDPWKALWESFQSNQNLDSIKKEGFRHLPANIPNLEFLTQFFAIQLQNELEGLQNIPLLHIQGDQDQVVNERQAKEYQKAREGTENTRFIQLPETDHDFSNLQQQAVAILETCAWFEKTL